MMVDFPAMVSLRHLLVLSLALNVSLILRMVYEGDDQQGSNNKNMEGYNRIIQKSRLVMPSTISANSTRKDHAGVMDKIINLDQ